MSGLKYHGGMKGLYAMLALTEVSLIDDDVETTSVRVRQRQDHEDEGQVTIHGHCITGDEGQVGGKREHRRRF